VATAAGYVTVAPLEEVASSRQVARQLSAGAVVSCTFT
jgi:hypothetical protein